MKKLLICLLAAVCVVNGINAQEKKSDKKSKTQEVAVSEMKNAVDSFSYAVGMNIATSVKDQGITEINSEIMTRAFDDVMKDRKKLLTPEQANMTLQQKLQEFAKKKSDAQKAKGVAFLEENKKRKEVVTLPSGLQYEVLQAGNPNGLKPVPADTVEVDYIGTLIDGTEFDSSVKRGEHATFPLNAVIRGWTEILQLMTVGSKWKVYIPSELAYGERGAGGQIPPYSTLIFEITLYDIKPAAVK